MVGVDMNKDELVQEIGALLLQDREISSRPWRDLVIVAQIMPNATKVNGFAYQDTGKAVPTGPDNFKILEKFEELREAMRESIREPWKACLVPINGPSGQMSIDFEYDCPEKWLINPATVKTMAETLRPSPP
jgi:hypothetical protein